MIFRFLSAAEAELFEAAAYYEMQAQNLGENFLVIIEAAVEEIVESPKTWPEIENGIHRCLIRRFPYSILYGIDDDEVVIVAIMHHKQKPRYWAERL